MLLRSPCRTRVRGKLRPRLRAAVMYGAAEHVGHRRPGHLGEVAQRSQRQRDRRQHDVGGPSQPPDGQPAQVAGEDQHQHRSHPVLRCRDRALGDERDRVVDLAAPRGRRPDPQRQRERPARAAARRGPGDIETPRAGTTSSWTGMRLVKENPKSPVTHVAQPVEVLHVDGRSRPSSLVSASTCGWISAGSFTRARRILRAGSPSPAYGIRNASTETTSRVTTSTSARRNKNISIGSPGCACRGLVIGRRYLMTSWNL